MFPIINTLNLNYSNKIFDKINELVKNFYWIISKFIIFTKNI